MRRSVVWIVPGLVLGLFWGPLMAADAEQETHTPERAARERPDPAPKHTPSEPPARSQRRASDETPQRAEPPAPAPSDEPATRAQGRVIRVLDRIERRLEETRYQHRTFVAEWRGLYAWDCSGMVTWVLERAARGARGRILSVRPVARDYVDVIDRSPTRGSYKGWQKLESVRDARRGDVFAWKRPPHWPRHNTGHVGFVLAPPRPLPGYPGAYLVHIADATSLPHEHDTRAAGGDGGYGEGTMLFTTDENGRPVAYGWYGSRSRGVVPTHVVFGRVHY